MQILKKVIDVGKKQRILMSMDDGTFQWFRVAPGVTEEVIQTTATEIQAAREAEKAEALRLKQEAEAEAALFEEWKKQRETPNG